MYLQEPRALRHSLLREQRISQLTEPHIAPLEAFSRELEDRERMLGNETYIPHFDPGDAGTEARILSVLEAPGPMTHGTNQGSGFISVDNNDQTAENTWQLRNESGATHGVLAWNIVPWFLGPASIKPRVDELRRGSKALGTLLELLPDLSTVILGGRYAQRGWTKCVEEEIRNRYRVIETWHPSPLALNRKVRRVEALEAWRAAR